MSVSSTSSPFKVRTLDKKGSLHVKRDVYLKSLIRVPR